MSKVSVILPAAGEGRRFGAETNKIFQLLAGRAIVLHTLERFASRKDVAEILLVLAARDMGPARDCIGNRFETWRPRIRRLSGRPRFLAETHMASRVLRGSSCTRARDGR